MKFLFVTDTHFTAKNPASRIDDIQETIINKLLDIKQIIADEKIDVVLHGGDMFHTPDVSNRFTGQIAEIFKSYGVPIYVVPGNHDIYGYNNTTLGNTKLGLLEKTGIINILDRANPLVFNDNGFRIGVEGQEYHAHIDEDMTEDYKIYNLNVDYSILITHSMLLEYKFFEGIRHTLINDVITSADLVLAGHYHPGFKEREKDGVNFFNPGSMLRVDASTDSFKNMPRVVVFDIDSSGMKHKYVELASAKKATEVFSPKNLHAKMYNNTLESFHNKLKNTKLKGVSILDLIDEFVATNNGDRIVADYAKNMISHIDSEKACDTGFLPEANTISVSKVEIFNFQAHSHKVVDFVDGLNVIRGESNAGKTAILRAIYWVLYDKPNGSDFIKTGAKSAKVRLHLSNGYIIERKRNRSTAGSYILIKPDGTSEEYKGFANNIPVEVTNAHQMPEIKINGTAYKINVASQLDTPFLIGNGPTERVSMIGALVDADRADAARKEFLAEKRRASTEKSQLVSLKEKQEIELAKYNHLEKLKSSIDVLEFAIGKLEGDEARLRELEGAKNQLNNTKGNLMLIESKLSSIKTVDQSIIEEYKEKLDKLSELYNCKSNYDSSLAQLDIVNSKLSIIPDVTEVSVMVTELKGNLNSIYSLGQIKEKHDELSSKTFEFNHDIDLYKNNLLELTDSLNKYESIVQARASYLDLLSVWSKADKGMRDVGCEISKLLTEKQSKIDSLKGVSETCPTCGGEIDFEKALNI